MERSLVLPLEVRVAVMVLVVELLEKLEVVM